VEVEADTPAITDQPDHESHGGAGVGMPYEGKRGLREAHLVDSGRDVLYAEVRRLHTLMPGRHGVDLDLEQRALSAAIVMAA
jgi:hypothetical protein